MMKNVNLITISFLLFTVLLSSCEDKYVNPLDEIDDIFDYNSFDEYYSNNFNQTKVSNTISSTDAFIEVIQDSLITDESPVSSQVHGDTVWKSKSGTKYHSKPTCSNMKSATEIPLEDAINQGLEPCKKCY